MGDIIARGLAKKALDNALKVTADKAITVSQIGFIDSNISYTQKLISHTVPSTGTYKYVDYIVTGFSVGDVYTLTLGSVANNSSTLVMALQTFNATGTELNHSYVNAGSELKASVTIPANTTKFVVRYYLSADISIASGTVVTYTDVLLVKGTELIATLKNYIKLPVKEPYPYYNVSYIANNRLYTNDSGKPTTARYNGIDLGTGKVPSGMNTKVIFTEGNSGASVDLVCNPNNMTTVQGITTNSLHIVFTDIFVQIGIWVSGSLVILSQPYYNTACKRDGVTEYSLGWTVSGDTITVNCPDGTVKTATDTRIPSAMGRYCTLEHYWQGADKARPISTYFEISVANVVVLTDDFNRGSGNIATATTGQPYTQFQEI